ncbi:MAG: 2TM domain-containing protein [Promethearchaeota archaeon]
MVDSLEKTPFSEEELKNIAREKILQSLAFKIHAIAFFGVNMALLMINYMINNFSFPWFVFPVAGWFVGIVAHGAYYAGYSRGMSSKKIGLLIHAATYFSGTFSLFLINYFSWFGYMWFLWPLVFWALGVLSHGLAYKYFGSEQTNSEEKKSWLERSVESELEKAKEKKRRS